MRLLVLGGTVFLSRAVAADAVAARARGDLRGARRPPARYPTARAWSGRPDPAAARPRRVRRGRRRRPAPFVGAQRGGGVRRRALGLRLDGQRLRRRRDARRDPATLPLVEAIDEDVDLKEGPEAYGPMKVACEQIVLDGAASAMVIRPGLIVGPGGPDRPLLLLAATARGGGEVLAPGRPGRRHAGRRRPRPSRVDVTACEQRTTGVYDGVGPAMPICRPARAVRRRSRRRTSRGPGSTRSSCRSRRSSRGPGRDRSRCGCPARSTTASRPTTCSPPSTRASPSARSPTPPATRSPGWRPPPTRWSAASHSTGNANCSRPGDVARP